MFIYVYWISSHWSKSLGQIFNAQFKEITGTSLTQLEVRALEHAEKFLSKGRL
jgi:hypothetical protein